MSCKYTFQKQQTTTEIKQSRKIFHARVGRLVSLGPFHYPIMSLGLWPRLHRKHWLISSNTDSNHRPTEAMSLALRQMRSLLSLSPHAAHRTASGSRNLAYRFLHNHMCRSSTHTGNSSKTGQEFLPFLAVVESTGAE